MKISELTDRLKEFDKDAEIQFNNGDEVNFLDYADKDKELVIISNSKPVGTAITGELCFKEEHMDIDYPYFCPSRQENMYGIEVNLFSPDAEKENIILCPHCGSHDIAVENISVMYNPVSRKLTNMEEDIRRCNGKFYTCESCGCKFSK